MNHTLSIRHYRILAEQLARSKDMKLLSLRFFTQDGKLVDPETWDEAHRPQQDMAQTAPAAYIKN